MKKIPKPPPPPKKKMKKNQGSESLGKVSNITQFSRLVLSISKAPDFPNVPYIY